MKNKVSEIKQQLQGIPNRAEKMLKFNLLFNLCFAIFYFLSAVVSRSSWMGTMAFYYIWLSIQRLLLRKSLSCDRKKQWKSHIRCGILLLFSSCVIVGMNVLLLRGVQEIVYPFYLIYGVAAYAFYSITVAIINVIKYRKICHPLFLANKNLSLVVAMISMLSMQSALLTAFGDNDAFSRNMSITTGFIIFGFVVVLSVSMIVFGRTQYKRAYNNWISCYESERSDALRP